MYFYTISRYAALGHVAYDKIIPRTAVNPISLYVIKIPHGQGAKHPADCYASRLGRPQELIDP